MPFAKIWLGSLFLAISLFDAFEVALLTASATAARITWSTVIILVAKITGYKNFRSARNSKGGFGVSNQNVTRITLDASAGSNQTAAAFVLTVFRSGAMSICANRETFAFRKTVRST